MASSRDSTGQIRIATCIHSICNGCCHPHRVDRSVDGGCGKDAIATQLHCKSCIRSGPDTSIKNDWATQSLSDQGDGMGIQDTESTADWRSERHDCSATEVSQSKGGHEIVSGVRKDLEAVIDEDFCSLHELNSIGKQGVVIANDFEFHPRGFKGFSGELRTQHCFG
jgi:hypothetical protein